MRGALVGNAGEDFAELRQATTQVLLLRGVQADATGGFALLGLAQHAGDPGVGVQQIGRGVALEAEHLLEVEAVVAGTVLGQVGVLDRGDAYHAADMAQFVFAEGCLATLGATGIALLDQLIGALLGFVEQVHQLDGAAVAGLEGAAIGAVHGAEAHVFELHGRIDEAGATGAIALGEQAGGVQIGDHLGQVVVVGALAFDVGRSQLDVEAVIDLLAVGQGDGVESLPEAQAMGIARLQRHHQFASTGGELRRGVEAALGRAVEHLKIRQLALGGLGLFFHVGQQHAELGTPVTHVVLADHLVAEELQHPRHGIADDGGAQVTDVHLLGQVRRGQVHHHTLAWATLVHAQLRVGKGRIQPRGQLRVILEEVEEAGAGDLHLAYRRVGGEGGQQLLGQLARLGAGRLGQQQGDVAGEVAVALVLGVLDLDCRRHVGRQGTVGDQAVEGVLDELADAVFHGHWPSACAERALR